MQLRTSEFHGIRTLECVDSITRIEDAMDLVAACFEHDAERVLLESRVLPTAFFDLSSGFAGEFLQKFSNYRIKLAAVFPSEDGYSDRFREFLLEAKRGRGFRVFASRPEAEAWLTTD
jgi:Domain of unknown function (DUF4180)